MISDLSLTRKILLPVAFLACLLTIYPSSSYLFGRFLQYEYHHSLIIWGFMNDNPWRWMSLGGGIAVALILCSISWRAIIPKSSIHGDARLAYKREIRAAKMFDLKPSSIILGRVGRKLLVFNQDLHAYLTASTGSGKGVSAVIPNLLHWGDSVICLDIKREGYEITSGFRHDVLGQDVWLFEPLSDLSHRFNPLDAVPDDDHRITVVQRIASTLMEVDDPFWDGNAQALCAGLILFLVEAGDRVGMPKTIGQLVRMTSSDVDIADYLENIISEAEKDGERLSVPCRGMLYSIINSDEKPRSGFRLSLFNQLKLWYNPIVDRATSGSDFDLSTFRTRPQTLHIVAAPKDIILLAPVFKMLLDTFLTENTQPGEDPKHKPEIYKHEVLVILDEFASLGPMPAMVHALSYVRSWGIKVLTVIQSSSQLIGPYTASQAESFESNHRVRIYHRPSQHNPAQAIEISESLGHYTGKSHSISKSSDNLTRQNVTRSEADLNLFTPDQIRNMPDSREIVLADGIRPIYCHKAKYFEMNYFKKRLRPAVALPPSLRELVALDNVPQRDFNQQVLTPRAVAAIRQVSIADASTPDGLNTVVKRLVEALEVSCV